MEARLGGLEPIVVTHTAQTLPDAIDGAAVKLQKTLHSTLGRLSWPLTGAPSSDAMMSGC